jgi:hypothetical protein
MGPFWDHVWGVLFRECTSPLIGAVRLDIERVDTRLPISDILCQTFQMKRILAPILLLTLLFPSLAVGETMNDLQTGVAKAIKDIRRATRKQYSAE